MGRSNKKRTQLRKRRVKGKKAITLPQYNGDHGTGTLAATLGTHIEPILNDKGNNPNNFGRRVRQSQSDKWKDILSMRQYQAARAIEEAYCRSEMISSGGEIKERVDASLKKDAITAAQVDTVSHLTFVMQPIPQATRPVIEHLFWHNLPLGQFVQGRCFYNRAADIKVALDLVANRLRY